MAGRMTTMQALQSCTRTAAEACGVLDRIGTLEPGKEADVFVVRDDPLVDVRNLREVVAVFKGANWSSTTAGSSAVDWASARPRRCPARDGPEAPSPRRGVIESRLRQLPIQTLRRTALASDGPLDTRFRLRCCLSSACRRVPGPGQVALRRRGIGPGWTARAGDGRPGLHHRRPPGRSYGCKRAGADGIYTVGEKFGTIGATFGDQIVEITTYRREQYEPGSRKPQVRFGNSLLGDLSRRDFTINAMAKDAARGEIIDPFGGQRDLASRTIRAVGDPAERFAEDPLRLLRAVRFAVQLVFEIEPRPSGRSPRRRGCSPRSAASGSCRR